MSRHFLPLLGFLALAGTVRAEVRLPALISNGMVLQRGPATPLWGTADAGEEVTARFGGRTATAKADAEGKWRLVLDLKDAPEGPADLAIQGKNSLTVSDVVVGEVWLASGQSNMEYVLRNSRDADAAIRASSNARLRMFKVKRRESPVPVEDVEGGWVSSSPQTVGAFSAVAYYFAKALQDGTGAPVGILNASVGGTPCEAWTGAEAIDSLPSLREARDRAEAAAREFPEKRKAFLAAWGAWLKKTGRDDVPAADPAAYAGEGGGAGSWIPLKMPGLVQDPGLPAGGAVWLRREVVLPAAPNGPQNLVVAADGFFDVYVNGQPVSRNPWTAFGGTGDVQRIVVPAGALRAGRNVLAFRFYEPSAPAKVASVQLGLTPLNGSWLARQEYAFPGLPEIPAPALLAAPPEAKNLPSRLFNGMIHPLRDYGIKGVVWYQGESNTGKGFDYRYAFPLLISDWRREWKQEGLPFYFCQLPANNAKLAAPAESTWAELRESQAIAAARTPHAGLAVLIDLGEAANVHPRDKKPVGERLAALALAQTYGKPGAGPGPVYRSFVREGGRIVLSFAPSGGRLAARALPAVFDVDTGLGITAPLVRNSPGSELEGFALCGEDRKWVWADARIRGDAVEVWADAVPHPVAARYAWADNPTCNLANEAGWPAAPFRTDAFVLTTEKSPAN